MDRPNHDYAAAMAFAQQQQAANVPQQQQQQQYGFHPQHQQYPPSGHGPPFLPPHPSLQQFPYSRPPIQQPQYPHPSHPHVLHMQQQRPPPAYTPHMPPHLVPPPFHGPYDSAPPPSPPPADPELQKRIDKLVEYSAKNGPEFEAMIRDKQKDNPEYSFLFGGEGHNYYRYKLFMATRPPSDPFNASFPSPLAVMHPPNPMMSPSPINAPHLGGPSSAMPVGMMGASHLHQPPFASPYEQQHPQSFPGHSRPEYDQSYRPFRGLSRPLPSDVEIELNNILNNLTGTKESIKGAKNWFMQRSPFLPVLCEALKDRIFSLDDSEKQLHIIYLANDILFDSFQRRHSPHEPDNEALAFKPVLGSMLARVFNNPINKEENQSRLQKILQFWASKEVYDQDTIRAIESEMIGGIPPINSFPGPQRDFSTVSAGPSASGVPLQGAWQSDKQTSFPNLPDQEYRDKQVPLVQPPLASQQFHPATVPSSGFPGAGAVAGAVPPMQPANQLPSAHTLPAPTTGEKLPPYPLFPPGLIPGMVRKMQIGSGVPYTPMSVLDIPTVIPPSNMSASEINERVSKFFKEIGEVNPSEGPTKSSETKDDYDDYERESPVRKGGACIPPPPNLLVDPESGTLPDGSVERKPGSTDSGRLGVGATANPNEPSQYDDVYTSYRKQRSTNYHSSMSARAAGR